jgi:hypothetical protein
MALAGMFAVLIWSTRDLRRRLEELVLGRSAVVDTADAKALMESELERARRLDYPLSVVTIRPDDSSTFSASSDQALSRITGGEQPVRDIASSTNLFRRRRKPIVQLRSTDVAVFDKQQQNFMVLLIGATRVDAEKVAERISKKIAIAIQQPLRYGCAEFPQDSYVFEDLLKRAETSTQSAAYPVLKPEFPSVVGRANVERV